ncbi:hypothetical protein M758_2G168700 [Ceratodon purpureus]|nr:hypothetical protein M758_2G168700 [Ceratodon purpureus]
MDSHFFEPMVQLPEQECMSKHHDAKTESLDQTQDELPNFLKWTTSDIRMEIPSSFLKTHFGRIGPRVKLQGLHEGSPVQDVTSTFSRERHPRLFLSGWRNFANVNLLRTGQRLIFMLIDDSFFVVRKI